MALPTDDQVVDILENDDVYGRRTSESRLPELRALYNRWEKQNWAIADVDVSRDRSQWLALRPFARSELMGALDELEVGEVFVSRTLSTLVTHAPSDGDRLFLSTQLADEARHAQFFQDYLHVAAGMELTTSEQGTQDDESAYAQLFEPRLRASIRTVAQRGGDREAWHAAVVEYHLVTEGVLAAAALHLTRQLARRLRLVALDEGLTNVIRDESRHLTYGLIATRAAVEGGLRKEMAEVYIAGAHAAGQVVVNPHTKALTPAIRPALVQRGALLREQWRLTKERALRQLRLIGLSDCWDATSEAWDRGCQEALAKYEEIWGVPHPSTAEAAAPLGSVSPDLTTEIEGER
jgi:ribonucleoside-diphosphate reductase beta chain